MQGLVRLVWRLTLLSEKNFSFYSVFVNAVVFFLVLAVRWSHEIKTHQQVTPGYVERKGLPILTEGLVSLQRKACHFFS